MDGVEEGTGIASGGDNAPTSTVRPAMYILYEIVPSDYSKDMCI